MVLAIMPHPRSTIIMLKFISSTVGSTTATITSVLELVDINLYVAIEESTHDAVSDIAKLTSTPEERAALRSLIASRRA